MKLAFRFVLRWWPASVALIAAGASAWATATMQLSNADQLINGFLFESAQTFNGATFPLEHTQLLKWPLFALLSFGHFAEIWYVCLTVIVAVSTLAGFACLLGVINRQTSARNVVFLLLVSVFLLVPAQAFDGGVSAPLGLSMLTGRNIEYLVYFGVLALYIKTGRLRSWQWASGTAALAVLFASDQLFVFLSLASAILFGIIGLITNSAYQRVAHVWLAGSVVAWFANQLLLLAISQFTHFATYPLGYLAVNSLPGVWQAATGTLQALALNFGLTPRAGAWSFPALALNIVTAGLILYATAWTSRKLFLPSKPSRGLLFAAMCLATSMVALGGFAVINQPYLQDARYIAVCVFAGFVMLAAWLRTVKLPHPRLMTAIATGIVILAAFASLQHTANLRMQDQLATRNQKIADVLKTHHVAFLVGNYWRVVPIHTLATAQKISPLQGCLQNIPVLSSSSWRPELLKQSFAYLLTAQSSGVPQAQCNKRQIVQRFGVPSSEFIIDGSQKVPHEELLFYDNGASIVRPR